MITNHLDERMITSYYIIIIIIIIIKFLFIGNYGSRI